MFRAPAMLLPHESTGKVLNSLCKVNKTNIVSNSCSRATFHNGRTNDLEDTVTHGSRWYSISICSSCGGGRCNGCRITNIAGWPHNRRWNQRITGSFQCSSSSMFPIISRSYNFSFREKDRHRYHIPDQKHPDLWHTITTKTAARTTTRETRTTSYVNRPSVTTKKKRSNTSHNRGRERGSIQELFLNFGYLFWAKKKTYKFER